MHLHFLDPYRHRQSLIHAFDPRVKFVFTLAFVLTMALLPFGAWPVYVLMLTLSLSITVLSELGVKYVLKRSLLAIPFVLAAVPLLFTVPGPALLTIPIGSLSLTITSTGLERLLSILFKSWVSVQVAIVFAAATPFPDMLLAMRAVKIPRLLVSLFGLMWRYMFVMVDEVIRLMRARSARSGALEGAKAGGSIVWRAKVTGGMAGNLFIRSIDRGERIYDAMAARGYDGEVRSFPLPPISSTSWIVLLGGLGLLVVLLLFALLFWA
ncbi:MAG: cobalt ECF transporter T component CbiQ [Chloroflexi bacterium]|jgi:cobalt/nickel transport system permease protein|nr:cobalt ECF transporter T component CbiQ [Chloroflexota bacterium]